MDQSSLPPSSSPSSSSSGPGSHSVDPTNNNDLSHISIGLIVAFHVCFVAFLLSTVILGPRLSRWLNATPPPSTTTNLLLPRTTRKKRRIEMHRPKLWEVRLNDDRRHNREPKPPSNGAIRNWQASHSYSPTSTRKTIINRKGTTPQPVAAWTDDDGTTPPSKAASAVPAGTNHHHSYHHVAAMTQPWCWGSYPFLQEHLIQPSAARPPRPARNNPALLALNVAVLVAMPSPRPEAPTHTHASRGTTSHPLRHDVAELPLSYGDGQLLMGVTTLPCEERVMRGRTTL
jgi:hypothetical protein